MKIFFVFLFVILCVSLVGAAGFSPSSLTYEIEQGKIKCMGISLDSESERITVTDRWAENLTVEWRASLFDKDASYHGLEVSYDKELLKDERGLEVCLSGQRIGEYHGIIVMEEELIGNTIIQMGVWMKVKITSEPVQPSGGGGGGGGGIVYSSKVAGTNESKKTEVSEEKAEEISAEEEIEQEEETEEESVPAITGAAVAEDSLVKNPLIWALIILIIAVVIAIAVFVSKRKGNL